MYVTKEQVEAMIALALANGPAAPGESTTDRQINSLAETVKALEGRTAAGFQAAGKSFEGLESVLVNQGKRLSVLEEARGFTEAAVVKAQPSAIEPGPMDTADDPGAVVAHAPEAAPQPVAVEPAQG